MSIAVTNNPVELQNIWRENLNDFYGRTYFSPMIAPINNYLLKHNKLEGNLLDIGCGYGEKANIFSKIGFDVTGIDNSKERIHSGILKFPEVNFFHFQIKAELPFNDDSFDVVFSNSVFQYLDHERILNECKRILKKGRLFNIN